MYFRTSECFGAGFGDGLALVSTVAKTGEMVDGDARGCGREIDSTFGTGEEAGARDCTGSCGSSTSATAGGAGSVFFGASTCLNGCGEGALGGGVGARIISAVDL